MEKNEFTDAWNRKNSDTATNRVCCENCGKEIQENVRLMAEIIMLIGYVLLMLIIKIIFGV